MSSNTIFHKLPVAVFCILINLCFLNAQAQHLPAKTIYEVSVKDPDSHTYHVDLSYTDVKTDHPELKMCAWTPGFYEIIDFAGSVKNFMVKTAAGNPVSWEKTDENTWKIKAGKKGLALKISYEVVADNPFIAYANLDKDYGYILPGALFMYTDAALKQSVQVKINPHKTWKNEVITGLTALAKEPNTFIAHNFDELYDSPLLMGKLEQISSFKLGNKPISYFSFGLGAFDRKQFSEDLYKIVENGSNVIGKIPFEHYSFMAVGMNGYGFGGIEHLNSSSLLVSNKDLLADSSFKLRYYHFLAHEYFHTYNVKRIRPIALGPFDYTKENYTNMLWVSEGFTDYYANLILNRAGLMSAEHVLSNLQEQIGNYENTPGHLYQSATQASHGIWAQRGMPTERTPEEVAKTISVYDKGSALGMLIDLKIRHETSNTKTLDEVMKNLYTKFYEKQNRGFTDKEFRDECEAVAGTDLSELFGYASTVKPVNYVKYMAYAGMDIDTALKALPVLSFGAETRWSVKDSTLAITGITWNRPAYLAGLKKGDKIRSIDGKRFDKQLYKTILDTKKAGESLQLTVLRATESLLVTVKLETVYEKSFKITRMPHPSVLQDQIYHAWLK
jgi:predicted metalloprotease with PDZ domain